MENVSSSGRTRRHANKPILEAQADGGRTVTTDRQFCRFNKSPETASFSVTEIPPDGLCLSAFLIVTEARHARWVLMGHMNPEAPWDHIGALDPGRVEAHRHGWMLPSSHIMFKEAPEDAAHRIAREQLELPTLDVSASGVFSEVYAPRRFAGNREHWDLEFLFRAKLAEGRVPRPNAWSELRFVDTETARKAEIARSHEDILAHAGLPLAR
jgi:ADP-ribose pyrophosphatase YjhB (NUDIX family)